nr:MAG TPA: hypothetical protein [Caudoviricetes sp.]
MILVKLYMHRLLHQWHLLNHHEPSFRLLTLSNNLSLLWLFYVLHLQVLLLYLLH